jgi:hypothetical protein
VLAAERIAASDPPRLRVRANEGCDYPGGCARHGKSMRSRQEHEVSALPGLTQFTARGRRLTSTRVSIEETLSGRQGGARERSPLRFAYASGRAGGSSSHMRFSSRPGGSSRSPASSARSRRAASCRPFLATEQAHERAVRHRRSARRSGVIDALDSRGYPAATRRVLPPPADEASLRHRCTR